MGQLVEAVKGIGEACRALDFPIVSGNVSLYNETNGVAILPTPTIAGVGLLPDWKKMARIGSACDGDKVILIGTDGSHLGSVGLPARRPRHHRRPGTGGRSLAPSAATATSSARRSATASATACHDISSGGLAAALSPKWRWRQARASTISLRRMQGRRTRCCSARIRPATSLTVPADVANFALRQCRRGGHALPPPRHGRAVTALVVDDLLSLPIQQLRDAHESWFPDYMEGRGDARRRGIMRKE